MKQPAKKKEFLHSLFHTKKWQIAILTGVIAFLYLRTLSFEFIRLDEAALLVQKQAFNKELHNIPKAFTQHVFQSEKYYIDDLKVLMFYRPLLTVSFIIDSQFSKSGFSFFHFTNILFHFFACIGLLFVLLNLAVPKNLSFLFTILFAVHPQLSQAIAWIPGRNDSMVAMFVLWSFYFLLKHLNSNKNSHLFYHLLFFTAALFTKENAVMLPVLCVLYAWLLNRQKLFGKLNLSLISAYTLLITGWYFVRANAVSSSTLTHSFSSLNETFLKNFPLLLQYFQKTLFPVNLAVMATPEDTNYLLFFLSLALLGTGIYFTKNIAWNKFLFGILWFFLFLLPTLLFTYFEGMEHRSYLPAIGLLIALTEIQPIRKLSENNYKIFGISGIVILAVGTITFHRLAIFKNELNYWTSAAATSSHSAIVCRELGIIQAKSSNFQSAETSLLEAIRRKPTEPLVHYNLAVVYLQTQRYAEAEQHLLQELKIDSTNATITYYVLGLIYKQTNRLKEEETALKKTIQINPDFKEGYKELMNFYSDARDSLNWYRYKVELDKRTFK